MSDETLIEDLKSLYGIYKVGGIARRAVAEIERLRANQLPEGFVKTEESGENSGVSPLRKMLYDLNRPTLCVVAGTYQQFVQYCREHELPTNSTVYVNKEWNLAGRSNVRFVLTGTYWELPQWPAISDRIEYLKRIGRAE